MNVAEAKDIVRSEIERLTPALLDLSHSIHANPELNFEEHHAHDVLTGVLEDNSIDVDRGAYDMPTAFDARVGSADGPTVAVLCEYDALPGIGHACGHNIIGSAGLGAGIAVAKVAEALGGRVAILGTPAEEGGGGKEFMIRRGAFDDIDLAMMVHPADRDLRTMHTIAIQQLHAHLRRPGGPRRRCAPQGPERPRRSGARLQRRRRAPPAHPPRRAHPRHLHRGRRQAEHRAVAGRRRVVRAQRQDGRASRRSRSGCTAASRAAPTRPGCEMHSEWIDPPFYDMVDNHPLLDLYVQNAMDVGRHPLPEAEGAMVVGSTDMGNVSYAVPSIHPMIKAAPEGTAIHTPDFEVFAGGEEGDRAVIDGALSMALTMVDCLASADTREEIRAAFTPSA